MTGRTRPITTTGVAPKRDPLVLVKRITELTEQLQAAQAERDEIVRERDALREALEDLHLSADFSFDDAGSMELVTYSRPAYLWRNLKHALRASTPSEDG